LSGCGGCGGRYRKMDALVASLREQVEAQPLIALLFAVPVVVFAVRYLLLPEKKTYALKKGEKVTVTLREAIPVTHNVKIFRFNLPRPNDRLGLPIGKHFDTIATIDGEEVRRPYTPTTSDDEVGYVDLIIKIYPNGKMGNHIDSLRPGDRLDIMGPKGMLAYNGNGKVKVSGRPEHQVRRINMICGGSGVTPMLQVLRDVLKHKEDPTELRMIFGNQTEDDILLKDELDACDKDPRFSVHYTLDRPPEGWKYSSGFVTPQMIQERLFDASSDTITLLCGPPGMINACKKALEGLGHDKKGFHSF